MHFSKDQQSSKRSRNINFLTEKMFLCILNDFFVRATFMEIAVRCGLVRVRVKARVSNESEKISLTLKLM